MSWVHLYLTVAYFLCHYYIIKYILLLYYYSLSALQNLPISDFHHPPVHLFPAPLHIQQTSFPHIVYRACCLSIVPSCYQFMPTSPHWPAVNKPCVVSLTHLPASLFTFTCLTEHLQASIHYLHCLPAYCLTCMSLDWRTKPEKTYVKLHTEGLRPASRFKPGNLLLWGDSLRCQW